MRKPSLRLLLGFMSCNVVFGFLKPTLLANNAIWKNGLGFIRSQKLICRSSKPIFTCALEAVHTRRDILTASVAFGSVIGSKVFAQLPVSIQSPGSEWADHTGPFSESDFDTFQKSQSGLKYADVVTGTGEQPKEGDSVRLHYSGYLMDGTKFDSSYRGALFPFSLVAKDAPPVAFKLEKGSLIPGFLEGVLNMKVGGRRILYIPSALGYGERGAAGVIPPNSALIFFVELRKVGSGIILQ